MTRIVGDDAVLDRAIYLPPDILYIFGDVCTVETASRIVSSSLFKNVMKRSYSSISRYFPSISVQSEENGCSAKGTLSILRSLLVVSAQALDRSPSYWFMIGQLKEVS
jgi:hypothetical protein